MFQRTWRCLVGIVAADAVRLQDQTLSNENLKKQCLTTDQQTPFIQLNPGAYESYPDFQIPIS